MFRKLLTAQLVFLSMSLSYNAGAEVPDTIIDDQGQAQELIDVETLDADQQALLEERPDLPDILRRFQVVCYASAGRGRGERFSARGWFPRQVQREAIERCERRTHWDRCYARGCHRWR